MWMLAADDCKVNEGCGSPHSNQGFEPFKPE
jgi:hypothetical protein